MTTEKFERTLARQLPDAEKGPKRTSYIPHGGPLPKPMRQSATSSLVSFALPILTSHELALSGNRDSTLLKALCAGIVFDTETTASSPDRRPDVEIGCVELFNKV